MKLFCLLVVVFVACAGISKPVAVAPPCKRILILGNSITIHYPKPSIGWHHSWGMAASDSAKDYVHLLREKLLTTGASSDIRIQNIAAYENYYDTFSLSRLDHSLSFQPDLVILRIGENVKMQQGAYGLFAASFESLVNYIRKGNPGCTILCAGSFWKKQPVDSVMNSVIIKQKHSYFLPLHQLSADSANMSYGLFENRGVAIHPSDAGMEKIANVLWEAIRTCR